MHVERIYCDSLAHSSWQTRVLFIGVWRPPTLNQKVVALKTRSLQRRKPSLRVERGL